MMQWIIVSEILVAVLSLEAFSLANIYYLSCGAICFCHLAVVIGLGVQLSCRMFHLLSYLYVMQARLSFL